MAESQGKTVAVIDGNSLMHRAFHAVPPTMTAPDGTPTNAAFGFMSMLIKFIEQAHPDAIICAFDRGRPAFRMEALSQYKAQRPPMDPNLKAQFPLIEDLLRSMDIPVVTLDGWEGDDILGTIAAKDEKLGYRTLLVTGDKDAYQLASDLTSIVTTKKGISDVAIYGPDEVVERYGVTPEQVPDFLGLKGDKSDNIPGVPGIGEKKAASMLQEFNSLEGIYENLDKFKGKQLENLTNNKDEAFLSRKVATIMRDIDIDVDVESASFPSFDPNTVTEAFKKVRFSSHLNKVLGFLDSDGAGASSINQVSFEGLEPFVEGQEAKELLESMLSEGALAGGSLSEGAPSDKDTYLGLSWERDSQASLFSLGLTVAVYTGKGTAFFADDEALEAISRLIRAEACATYDVKALIENVYPADTAHKALVSEEELLSLKIFDIALANYVLHSSRGGYSIAEILEEYAGQGMPETKGDNPKERLAHHAAASAHLASILKEELNNSEAQTVYEEIDYPLIAVLACMERTGAALDTDTLAQIAQSTQEKLDKLKKEIIDLAGEEFNIDSPKQLSHILFEVLGLKPIKKTQRGYSTNAQVLKELAKVHELPSLVLHYREFAKIKSTYIDALPRMRKDDGRVHTSFNEMVTTTGRLSSSDPNLQNIPVRTEFGRHIRECFVPFSQNEVFLSADYSQIELRLLAHLSQDEKLIQAFLSGADFHAQTASQVFEVPVEEVTPLLRSKAKAVNFGIVYGQQAFGLSQSLDIPFYEAKQMIDRYFEVYSGVRAYLDGLIESATATGYAQTLFDRRRYIPELHSSNKNLKSFGERTAMNHPMQGTAADIIKIAMRRVQEKLIEEKLQTKLMLQVHDELDFSVPVAEVEKVRALVKGTMEHVVDLKVPLLVDVSTGKNWAEAH